MKTNTTVTESPRVQIAIYELRKMLKAANKLAKEQNRPNIVISYAISENPIKPGLFALNHSEIN